MLRPTTKRELHVASALRFNDLRGLIDALPTAKREADFKPGTMNRNIRDVLGHLHHWHVLFLDWHAVGMKGGKPHMPAEGFTWAQNTDLNELIHGLYTGVPPRTMRERFSKSHAQVHALIAKHSDRELFTKKQYTWTGSTSLGAYLDSATCSHYEWAIRLIRKGLRS
jgi:hypothetical protein